MVRGRRQVWTVPPRGGEGEGGVDVYVGVNGFVWVCAQGSVGGKGDGGGGGITRLEDAVDEKMYSARNERVGWETRREIGRVAGCVRMLAEGGGRVDEEMVMRVYGRCVEEEEGMEVDDDDGEEGGGWFGGERGRRIVREVVEGGGR